MSRELEFTGSSFLRIATMEARRGRDDPGQMFPSVNTVINELRDLHKQRRDACAHLWKTDEQKARETYATFRTQINEKQAAKKILLEEYLQQVSAQLATALKDRTFTWGLSKGPNRKTRQTYSVRSGPDCYFPMKQLETNLKNAYHLHPPNRNRLVAQLRDSLEGQLPRFVIRTDITSFYESIPHTELLRVMSDHRVLSSTSLRLICTLLAEWEDLSSKPVGIPTGVGLSSYLGEVYARQIDATLAVHPAVHFYGRYVDDIVIVTHSIGDLEAVTAELKKITAHLGLSLNASKTKGIEPNSTSGDAFDLQKFDFLGYSIRKSKGEVTIDLSKSTIARYKKRVEASFDRWAATTKPSSGHQGLLLDRIRFLAGNTKLINSKGRAVTGIYFNYPQLTAGAKELLALDKHLKAQIDTHSATLPPRLQGRLNSLSFADAFKHRTFHRFRQSNLERLVAVWRA